MAKPSTYIKLDRNIMKWRWYQDPNTFRVFIHLLLTANIEGHDFEETTVNRGDVVTSYAKLASELGMTSKMVRTAIDHLIATGEVARSSHPKYSVFSILNYDVYQKSGQARGKVNLLTNCEQPENWARSGAKSGARSERRENQAISTDFSQLESEEGKPLGNNLGSQRASKGQGRGQQLKNNKEIKERKEYNARARETDLPCEGNPSPATPKVGETVYFTNYRGDRVPHVWREKDAVRFKANGYTDVERYILEMT